METEPAYLASSGPGLALPQVQDEDGVVAIPEPPCSTIPSCALLCPLAHGAKSQSLCLPLAWSKSAGFSGCPLVCGND